MPVAWGSKSRISAPVSRRTPARPLAAPRRSSSSSRGSSSAEVATISLPQRSWAIPSSAQKRNIARAPSAQRVALSEPGL